MKICGKCKISKKEIEFHKNSISKDNLQNRCKSCVKYYDKINAKVSNKRHRDNYTEKREDINKRHRNRYAENPKKKRDSNRRWSKANPHMHNSYGAKYRAKKLQQTPLWVGPEEFKQIEALYAKCFRLTREIGIQYHVDHYYPLNSPRGSGLHCLANLRIITAIENLSKGNKWPD
jgi:hypothetical protein